jgi:nucleoside 2-deoxyribosyltransferase
MTSDPKTREWRNRATQMLAIQSGLDGFGLVTTVDPFRGQPKEKVSKDGLKGAMPGVFLSRRDKWTIDRCDVMLMCVLGIEDLKRQSIGTWAEFGYAGMTGKVPVIVVADHQSVLEHPFVEDLASVVVPTLEEAVKAILWLRLDTK